MNRHLHPTRARASPHFSRGPCVGVCDSASDPRGAAGDAPRDVPSRQDARVRRSMRSIACGWERRCIAHERAPAVEAHAERERRPQLRAAPPARLPGLEQHASRPGPVRVVRRHHGVIAGVRERVRDHLLGACVVGVGLLSPRRSRSTGSATASSCRDPAGGCARSRGRCTRDRATAPRGSGGTP